MSDLVVCSAPATPDHLDRALQRSAWAALEPAGVLVLTEADVVAAPLPVQPVHAQWLKGRPDFVRARDALEARYVGVDLCDWREGDIEAGVALVAEAWRSSTRSPVLVLFTRPADLLATARLAEAAFRLRSVSLSPAEVSGKLLTLRLRAAGLRLFGYGPLMKAGHGLARRAASVARRGWSARRAGR